MPNDAFAYFCGGPGDGTCIEIRELTNSTPSALNFPITEYDWSEDKVESAQGWLNVRVWHWKSDHEHTDASYKGNLGYEGPVLLEQMWAEIDALYKKFNNDNTMSAEQTHNLKGVMRGIAWCIALWMQPYFRTADEVVAEVMKRGRNYLDDDSDYQTPGLGRRRTEMVTSKYSDTKTQPTLPTPVARHNLTDAQVTSIRNAKTGGFPVSELAAMYSVKPEVIESI